ncbi:MULTISPECIES: hypothetical protein [unclassified Phyllobacterium]|uniref:DUF6894 family protein n=1 Tax=Phyllobacterium TaxID=28100 RepID=UPI000DD66F4D|nr:MULTISPECIES: hypothetical protein [unclassified Phyllobacterium]MBA8903031.1 hypothetical protein [Phyllobacterium sp. P30BS-XVII]UGX89220.1 hypothetical protein LLE53_022425 [Phyllobacterium sp. T1293]
MSRYYFDLHNGDGRFIDEDGVEMKSREDVTKQASRILLDIARDEIPEAGRGIASISIRDSKSKPIGLISLTFVTEWFDESEPETTKANR